ncbi:MAG: T9SS type A sorting domain-containing protein [Bacteroidaceae bacterium]|nr:T9SS type A sorting domain-containing protein [Bacteroidaceae bacterium]
MKPKFYPMIAAALLLIAMPCSRAEKHISIEMSDAAAAPAEVDISKISKIRFDATAFNVEFRDATASDAYNYTQVKRITFKNGPAALGEVDVMQPLVVMPNPVQDNLYLVGGNDLHGTDVNVYSVIGMHVMKVAGWNGDAIDVSHLAPGVYVINIQSTTLKFVKL